MFVILALYVDLSADIHDWFAGNVSAKESHYAVCLIETTL